MRAPLSKQGRVVLTLLARQPSRWHPLPYVRRHLAQQGLPRSLNSAKASFSRMLRRLWRLGYVELADTNGQTLTERHRAIDQHLAIVERNPGAAFEAAQQAAQGSQTRHRRPVPFLYQSAEEYLAHARGWAQQRHQRQHPMAFVASTPAGEARVVPAKGRLTDRCQAPSTEART